MKFELLTFWSQIYNSTIRQLQKEANWINISKIRCIIYLVSNFLSRIYHSIIRFYVYLRIVIYFTSHRINWYYTKIYDYFKEEEEIIDGILESKSILWQWWFFFWKRIPLAKIFTLILCYIALIMSNTSLHFFLKLNKIEKTF